jgi:hypothetical protein
LNCAISPNNVSLLPNFDLYFCDKYHMTLRPVTMENWAQNKVATNPFLPSLCRLRPKQPRTPPKNRRSAPWALVHWRWCTIVHIIFGNGTKITHTSDFSLRRTDQLGSIQQATLKASRFDRTHCIMTKRTYQYLSLSTVYYHGPTCAYCFISFSCNDLWWTRQNPQAWPSVFTVSSLWKTSLCAAWASAQRPSRFRKKRQLLRDLLPFQGRARFRTPLFHPMLQTQALDQR